MQLLVAPDRKASGSAASAAMTVAGTIGVPTISRSSSRPRIDFGSHLPRRNDRLRAILSGAGRF